MKKKILSLMLALTFVFSTLLPATSLANTKDLNVSRISGSGRYETAVEASKATFDKSKYAVVASGEKFADALVGGTLAVQIEAPILLVGKNSIPSVVSSEIKRLGAEKVYLLGGTGTVSNTVENQIKNLGVDVERLAGKDREETSDKIMDAKLSFTTGESRITGITLIDGYNFADSLSAAPLIGRMSSMEYGIMLLYPYTAVDLNKEEVPPMIIGGYNSVPKLKKEGDRFAGSDRYETAVKVADAHKTKLMKDIDTVVLVDGTEFPDALSSAPVASMNNGAILLTHPTNFSKATKDYINNNDNIKNVIIVGGENSVSKNIENELKGIETPTVDASYIAVNRVVDGDTFEVTLNGKKEKVRLLLVDTPESVHSDSSKNTAYGKIASDFTKNLIEGKKVKLEFDVAERDRYGRLLAYVYLEDGRMLNEILLQEGHAKVAVYQPNVKYVDKFRQLEKEAQAAKKGIWADGVSAFEPNNNTNTDTNTNNNTNNTNNDNSSVVSGNYIANSNTGKYHLPDCRWVKEMSNSNKVPYKNKADAEKAGYQACKVCKP